MLSTWSVNMCMCFFMWVHLFTCANMSACIGDVCVYLEARGQLLASLLGCHSAGIIIWFLRWSLLLAFNSPVRLFWLNRWHFKLKPWPVFLFLFLTHILGPNSGASAYTSGSLSAKPSSPSPDDHEESHESCHEITRSSIGTTIQRIFDSLPSFSSSDLYKYPIPTMRLFRLVCPP